MSKVPPPVGDKPIENVAPVDLGKPAGRVLGIDVSHYEPPMDWVRAKASGVQWMYTKASEGLTNVDVYLHKHCDAAKAAGVMTGAYHFFHANLDGAEQARHYLDTVKGMTFDLPHQFDWESASANDMSSTHQQAEALKWLQAVEAASGKIPVIYGGEAFMRELALPAAFARYPLWVAHYGVAEARLRVPAPWKSWLMWQYTDAETVGGLAAGHHVDANWFNGSMAQLQKFAAA